MQKIIRFASTDLTECNALMSDGWNMVVDTFRIVEEPRQIKNDKGDMKIAMVKNIVMILEKE